MQAEESEATGVTTPPAPFVSFTCSCVEAKDMRQWEKTENEELSSESR